MNTDEFRQQNANDVAVNAKTPIDFSSLRPALQRDCKENNVANVIAQLLQMYHPEDDITAYERVLRKVQSLLKDRDFCKKQLLLSMIPVPKNTSDHMVAKVFHATTGFIKLSLPKNNICQDVFDVNVATRIEDNDISASGRNFSRDENSSGSKSSQPEGLSFRGFAESEIFTTADSLSCQLSNNPENWSNRSNTYQTSPSRQYLLNKKFVPDARSTRTYDNTEIIIDLRQDKISQRSNIKFEYKKDDDTDGFRKGVKSVAPQAAADVDQNATIEWTIKNSIHRMDVCQDEDESIFIDADEFLPRVSNRLKTSLSMFLRRAREGIVIELSTFPRTRSYPRANSSVYSSTETRKPAKACKSSEKVATPDLSGDNNDSCLLSKRQKEDFSNLSKNYRAPDDKTKQEVLADITELQMKRMSRELNKSSELPLLQGGSDRVLKNRTIAVPCKEIDAKTSMIRKTAGPRLNNFSAENNFQARSISELAAYKKQYYDTLLSVQRAKVAVTNSLASASDHLTVYDDPYYSNYACQQQHLFQRQFTMRPQFSTCPTVLSGLPGTHGNQYSWARSDCKYLLLKQLSLRRQTSPAYGRNQGGWSHRYVGPMYSYPFVPSGSSQTEECVRRKSLEDIVGKLKGVERAGVEN